MDNFFNISLLQWGFPVILLLLACGERETTAVRQSEHGFERMKDSIEAVVSRTNYEDNIYANDRRVELYRKKVEETNGQDGQIMFRYAVELLNNGQTERAIEVTDSIMKKFTALAEVKENSLMLHKFQAICYLRLGEQYNCLHNHNDASCIIPLKEDGIYTKQTASQQAIEKYKEILEITPDDMESRWLLNLAYITIGGYPDQVPEEYLVPLPEQEGVQSMENIATRTGLDHFGLSGGVITDDFNNDGKLDIIMSSWGFDGTVQYFRNEGSEGFKDMTEESGLDAAYGGLNLKQADYNNDGHVDFFIMRGAWKPNLSWGIPSNSLIKNKGDGTFEDVTFSADLYSRRPTQSAEWIDYNNDGWLDLFVANETTRSSKRDFPCELFRNNGDGTFTEVASELGVDYTGYFKGVTSGDIDNDGWMDLYITNLYGDNILLLNQYDQSEDTPFKNITEEAGVERPQAAFPAWFFDYDNDGWVDLLVTTYGRMAFTDQAGQFARDMLGKEVQTERTTLYRNTGNLKFEDVSHLCCAGKSISTMGSNYGDIHNDGYPDMYLGTGAPGYRYVVPNRFLTNREGKRFEEQTFGLGLGHIQKGHGVSFSDLDNDGDQDIYIVMGGAYQGDKFPNALFENKGYGNNWIKLDLEGVTSNRSAIGAKIRVRGFNEDGTKRTVYTTVNSGGSFGGNPLIEHIGLGDMNEVEEVAVRWPTGTDSYTSLGPLTMNKAYKLKEGEDPVPLNLESFPFNKDDQRTHNHHSMH